ncbi:hypothetical protein MLPM_0162 [Mycobacterium lepromatosis]|uniref:Uncharacterized protein n=1 Tax=Mycobacterium lepromatosis TaxID=480418 RepID=A0A0F4EW10_9MYCO|nr:hypothetical protein MLPM_0162 [Mycobacterium lepromatosis]
MRPAFRFGLCSIFVIAATTSLTRSEMDRTVRYCTHHSQPASRRAYHHGRCWNC